jgi:hypothetical protein
VCGDGMYEYEDKSPHKAVRWGDGMYELVFTSQSGKVW